jgi:hypothetical protein
VAEEEFGPGTSLERQTKIHDEEEAGTYVPQSMSIEEVGTVQKKMEAMANLLREDEIKATYKLEVHFGKNRVGRGLKAAQPFAGAIALWVSGSKLHGGGDEKLYECPRPECEGLIHPEQLGGAPVRDKDTKEMREVPVGHCGHCNSIWPAEKMCGERLIKLTEQDWAFAILKMFIRLKMDADIYLKFHPTDIRYQTAMEMARNRGGEAIALAKKNRGLAIYPLKNIIKDTKHGAELYTQFRKFINA